MEIWRYGDVKIWICGDMERDFRGFRDFDGYKEIKFKGILRERNGSIFEGIDMCELL